MDRNETIDAIKKNLRARSGKTWSVTGGSGTAWGWIRIHSVPKRRDEFGCMSAEDRAELAKLLDKDVHHQGESIPASSEYRREYVERSEGKAPTKIATPYWD